VIDFRYAQNFIEQSRLVTGFDELQSLLDAAASDMGFDNYALIQHVDIGRKRGAAIWLENYPSCWADLFVRRKMFKDDPILLASQNSLTGFRWDEIGKFIQVNNTHRSIFEAAAREGIGNGFTIPAHIPGEANGSCNFAVRTGKSLPDKALPVAQLVGCYAFEAGRRLLQEDTARQRPRRKLTGRQLDCLILVGRGKSNWEISRILGLKEDTVTEYLDNARRSYHVERRVQLLVRAVYDGHLELADLL
jgi:LuxR family quorum-sensing system transcriptional regulator CciR